MKEVFRFVITVELGEHVPIAIAAAVLEESFFSQRRVQFWVWSLSLSLFAAGLYRSKTLSHAS